jgi:hypothetical protein
MVLARSLLLGSSFLLIPDIAGQAALVSQKLKFWESLTEKTLT